MKMNDDPLYFSEDDLTDKLTDGEKDILTKAAQWIVKKQLTAPAILFFEPLKPISFIGSQAVLFFEPFIRILPGTSFTTRLRSGLGKRDGIEFLLTEIERIENEKKSNKDEKKKKSD